MSFQVFFSFSTGLSKPITVPKGWTAQTRQHIADFESALGLKCEQNAGNSRHWTSESKQCEDIADDVLCDKAERHNTFVVYTYRNLGKWSESPPKDGELLTPEIASEFWHGLDQINVPAHRWNDDYYVERMKEFYEALRGRDGMGMSLDAKPLTEEQADSVISLIAQWLDPGDTRLAVPKGSDALCQGDDYAWCAYCGALEYSDARHALRYCRKRCGKGGCDLRKEYTADML